MDPPKQLGWYSEHGRAPTGEFSRSLGSFGVRGGFCTYQGPRRRVATTERLSSRGRYGPWLAEAPGALTSGVALRLFCVPPVGMGGAAFHPWVAEPGKGVVELAQIGSLQKIESPLKEAWNLLWSTRWSAPSGWSSWHLGTVLKQMGHTPYSYQSMGQEDDRRHDISRLI